VLVAKLNARFLKQVLFVKGLLGVETRMKALRCRKVLKRLLMLIATSRPSFSRKLGAPLFGSFK